MTVTRWTFNSGAYTFPRNPDRFGGDTYWLYEPKITEVDVIGANKTRIQLDGFRGATRTIKFTAITGTMMRVLQYYYLSGQTIPSCTDHFGGLFDCFISSFMSVIHPTIGTFPGSGEDTWDLEMVLIMM